MLSFWIVSDDGDHGSILAPTQRDAEIMHFEGILHGEYPINSVLIEQILESWEAEVYEPVDDADIISIEDAP